VIGGGMKFGRMLARGEIQEAADPKIWRCTKSLA
jgi:hypothetical protein